MDIEVQRSVPCLNGKLSGGELASLQLVLLNESVFNDRTRHVKLGLGLATGTLKILRDEPFASYQNVVFNDPAEIENELAQLLACLPAAPVEQAPESPAARVLLVDATRFEDGNTSSDLMQELEKIAKSCRAVRAFMPFKALQARLEEVDRRVYSEHFVTQKLETNFFLDKQIPGVIGPFLLENVALHPDSNEALCLPTVLKFVSKYHCPVLVDCTRTSARQAVQLLAGCSEKSRCVLFGLLPKVHEEYSKDSARQTCETRRTCSFAELLEALSAGFTVQLHVFDLFRAGLSLREVCSLVCALMENPAHRSRLILGIGVRFKTDLLKFSGEGFKLLHQLTVLLATSGELAQADIARLVKDNALQLLNWWRPLKVEVKEEKSWTCDECGKTFPESVPNITKKDSTFCSLPCLKAGAKKIK